MRIISKNRDYYDSAQSFGQDMNIVYKRDTLEYTYHNIPENVKAIVAKITNTIRSQQQFYYSSFPSGCVMPDKKQVTFKFGYIAFCGKIYPFVKAHYSKWDENSPEDEYFYSLKEFEKYTADATFSYQKWHRHMSTLFNIPEQEQLYQFLVENKVISLLIFEDDVVINPILSNYQFYRAKAAWEAYQEIDSYICGVLTFPQNAMVEIEDKFRIEQHGFDKWSFRKLPTKHKK